MIHHLKGFPSKVHLHLLSAHSGDMHGFLVRFAPPAVLLAKLPVLVFVGNSHPLQMVIEGCTRQLSDCEQKRQREFLPQFLNYLRFLRWRRSSSKTKACKFFR